MDSQKVDYFLVVYKHNPGEIITLSVKFIMTINRKKNDSDYKQQSDVCVEAEQQHQSMTLGRI